jgi:enolase
MLSASSWRAPRRTKAVASHMARAVGYRSIESRHSSETEEAAIPDLAVVTGIGRTRTGSLGRTDRPAKYNPD